MTRFLSSNYSKANYRVTLLHMSRKKIKDVDTDKMIPQFYVEYMSMPYLKQNNTFREQVDFSSKVLYKDFTGNEKWLKRKIFVLLPS